MSFLKGVKDEIRIKLTAYVDQDDGKQITVPFSATYRRLKFKDATDVVERARKGEITDDDIINDHLIGWELPGEGGPVEFTPENVAAAMQELPYRNALVDGFSQAQFGRKAALAKN